MHVSHESPAQTDARLAGVLAAATIRAYDEPYTFDETARTGDPPVMRADALALIGDDEVWSQLVPSSNPSSVA